MKTEEGKKVFCGTCDSEKEYLTGRVLVVGEHGNIRYDNIDLGWHCMKCSEAGKDGDNP